MTPSDMITTKVPANMPGSDSAKAATVRPQARAKRQEQSKGVWFFSKKAIRGLAAAA